MRSTARTSRPAIFAFGAFAFGTIAFSKPSLAASLRRSWPRVAGRTSPASPISPNAATFAAIGGIAALSTALAYVLYFRILSTAGATNLLLVTFLIPVSAILLGWLVLVERLDHRHLLGMALIGAGLAAIDGRLLRLRCRKMPEVCRHPAGVRSARPADRHAPHRENP